MEVQAQSMTIITRTAVVLIRVNTWKKDITGRMCSREKTTITNGRKGILDPPTGNLDRKEAHKKIRES